MSGEEGGRSALAAGLILAAVALLLVVSPMLSQWAEAAVPGAGIVVGASLALLLCGGFIGVFWLRARARRGTSDAELGADDRDGEGPA